MRRRSLKPAKTTGLRSAGMSSPARLAKTSNSRASAASSGISVIIIVLVIAEIRLLRRPELPAGVHASRYPAGRHRPRVDGDAQRHLLRSRRAIVNVSGRNRGQADADGG